eukprot:CAMPEP_0113586292 /NCGR_PEP_ID=MMETSP0015_2-20120614/34218_1 /TAXON_ID=2838 /ORGANISM="Odontella" /LENGTH=420 /DNA_ID=CAMNT_0000491717 /DNA_START=222 /DNA_END=1480 /DNA_ORIENTATION=- /assembly_acc=CAM_ASM_000160
MAAVLSHFFRPRGRHERIREQDEEDDNVQSGLGVTVEGESGTSSLPPTATLPGPITSASASVEAVLSSEEEMGAVPASARTQVVVETVEDEETGNAAAVAGRGVANNVGENTPSADGSDPSQAAIPTGQQDRLRAYLTQRRLAEIEEERDLRRRRQSTCTLVVVFVLFRLWVQALAEGDVGLLFVCLVGTSWTARWIRTRREEEEEMDRAIEAYVREAGGTTGGVELEGGRTMTATAGGAGTVDASDLRFMSFQAQLALAIMESQRQVMEGGGHGHPDGVHGQSTGVSEEARGRWNRYSFRANGEKGGSSKPSRSRRSTGYGSVSATDDEENGVHLEVMEEGHGTNISPEDLGNGGGGLIADGGSDDDSIAKAKAGLMMDESGSGQPACSICLGDYEEGERLVRLPCGHVYHEECVTAWV